MDGHKATHPRYARRIEQNGTWTVFDLFTGHTAEVGSRLTAGMQMSDAEEIMDVLNYIHPANDQGTIH
jgi:hypothetical protein